MKLSPVSFQALLEMIFDAVEVRAAPLKLFQNSLNLPEGAAAEINQVNTEGGFHPGVCQR